MCWIAASPSSAVRRDTALAGSGGMASFQELGMVLRFYAMPCLPGEGRERKLPPLQGCGIRGRRHDGAGLDGCRGGHGAGGLCQPKEWGDGGLLALPERPAPYRAGVLQRPAI